MTHEVMKIDEDSRGGGIAPGGAVGQRIEFECSRAHPMLIRFNSTEASNKFAANVYFYLED